MYKWIVALLGVVVITGACANNPNEGTMYYAKDKINVYLLNSSEHELVNYSVEIEEMNTNNKVIKVIELLKTGAKSEEGLLIGTLPEIVKIKEFELKGGKLTLDISNEFIEMNQIDYLICRSSLIRSLTDIEGVEAVEFYIEGLPMKNSMGKRYGEFYSSDVRMTMGSEELISSENIILYFPSSNGDYLIRVDRTVSINPNERIEKRIIEELMIPPEHDAVIGIIPEGTIVKSIRVNSKICYIDFNEAFKTKNSENMIGETMIIYSIVNSLTELPNISRVQFLIDGEKRETYKGNLALDDLFEYNIELVSKEISIEQ